MQQVGMAAGHILKLRSSCSRASRIATADVSVARKRLSEMAPSRSTPEGSASKFDLQRLLPSSLTMERQEVEHVRPTCHLRSCGGAIAELRRFVLCVFCECRLRRSCLCLARKSQKKQVPELFLPSQVFLSSHAFRCVVHLY